MRKWLFELLKDTKYYEYFPPKYLKQEMLAESDMVNWLIYPTELGTAPDEIELGKRIKIDTQSKYGEIEYFIFKFRNYPPHWSASDGWMAGVSGPFQIQKYPTCDSLGDTFSSFEAWASKTPEEHLGNIQKILEKWKNHVK